MNKTLNTFLASIFAGMLMVGCAYKPVVQSTSSHVFINVSDGRIRPSSNIGSVAQNLADKECIRVGKLTKSGFTGAKFYEIRYAGNNIPLIYDYQCTN
jgi:hypothetical protein